MSLQKPIKQYYNECEAATLLSISVPALREILDSHVFSHDNPRPDEMEFTYSELLLLSVWAKPDRGANVLEMPTRQ
jgi:hypothetical protein